jgi:hypothetical protein
MNFWHPWSSVGPNDTTESVTPLQTLFASIHHVGNLPRRQWLVNGKEYRTQTLGINGRYGQDQVMDDDVTMHAAWTQ